MDDLSLMGGRQPVGDLRREVQEQLGGPWAREHASQALSLHELHHDVWEGPFLPDVVDRDDVGVVEGRRGARLRLEALEGLGPALDPAADDLDRDLAPEARIERAIDLSHTSGAQARANLVASQSAAGCEARRRWGRRLTPAVVEGGARRVGEGVPAETFDLRFKAIEGADHFVGGQQRLHFAPDVGIVGCFQEGGPFGGIPLESIREELRHALPAAVHDRS